MHWVSGVTGVHTSIRLAAGQVRENISLITSRCPVSNLALWGSDIWIACGESHSPDKQFVLHLLE